MSSKSNSINNSKDQEPLFKDSPIDSFPTTQIAPEDYVHIYHFDPKLSSEKSPPKSSSKSKSELKKNKKSSVGSNSSSENKANKINSNESISQSRHKTSNLGFVNAAASSNQKPNKHIRVKSIQTNRKSNKTSSGRLQMTKTSKSRPIANSKSKFATITSAHKTQKGISNDSLTNKNSSENEVPEWILEFVTRFVNGLPEQYSHRCDKHCKCKSKKHRSNSNTSRQLHRKHKSKQTKSK